MTDPVFKAATVAAMQTEKAKKKKSHPGITHPQWKGGPVRKNCLWCGGMFFVAQYKDREGNGKYCSRLCFEAWQSSGVKKTGMKDPHKKQCKVCDKVFFVPKCLDKTAKYCSRRCLAIGNVMFSPKFKNTSIELKLFAFADKIGLEYVTHKHIGRITVPDMFVEPNIAIYADGDYWHSRPETVARDDRINRTLRDTGYEVIRFSESVINEQPETVIKELEKLITRQKVA